MAQLDVIDEDIAHVKDVGNRKRTPDDSGAATRVRVWWDEFFPVRIARVIGIRYVLATFILYGIDQGCIESLVNLPQIFFYKDLRGLNPADTTRAITYEGLSFSIKPLFALIMDGLPLFGWHYRPYLFLFGSLGTAAYAIIATAGVAGTLSINMCIMLFFLGMNAVVWNDTAIDGLTTQKIKVRERLDERLND